MQVFQVHSEANKSCPASGENFIPKCHFWQGGGGQGAVGKSWVTLGKCFKHKTYVIRSTVSAEDCAVWDNPTKWTTSSNVSLSKMAAFS